MKNVIVLIVLLSAICNGYAQDLTISFQPKESSNQIDSVRATNLRTNEIVNLLDGESLLLKKDPTGIISLSDKLEPGCIYPNPADENAILCFSTSKSQEVDIRLNNASGQLLNQRKQSLTQGTHRFQLKFPVAGLYFLSILKNDGPESFKVVYTGSKMQNSSIDYTGSEKLNLQKPDTNQLKSAKINGTLKYRVGDVILYTFFSGVNTTIVTDPATLSKVIEVEFVSCKDNDNKSYKVLKIGDQWWMAENLAWLPVVSPPSEGSTSSPYYYVYDYLGTDVPVAKLIANYRSYGVLYNWPAALSACPPGWHLPNDAEWMQVEMALGMTQAQADLTGSRGTDQGDQMKATSGWFYFSNGNGTNTSGFTALPAGERGSNGSFNYIGITGNWWSSTEYDSMDAWNRVMSYGSRRISRVDNNLKDYGFSVRCVRNSDADFIASPTSIIKGQSVQFTDKSTNGPTSWLWNFGDGTTSTLQNPSKTYSIPGTYNVSLKVTNSNGNNTKILTNYITCINDDTDIYTDTRDGDTKVYKTVKIGNQWWFAENLAYLPAISPPSVGSATSPYYYVYGYTGTSVAEAKATANYSAYGVLYNWSAAKLACPLGWHLPSDAEWKQLEMTLGMTQSQADLIGGRGTDQGKQMKATSGWYVNGNTNTSGFTALPAGTRYNAGTFGNLTYTGTFWSSNEVDAYNALFRDIFYTSSGIYRFSYYKEEGYSVRCVKD